MDFKFNEEVADALRKKKPIVALESTVIAHGLPYPKNLETAQNLERIVRENGAIPATIAVFDGEFCVGLNQNQIEQLATDKNIRKISRRDLPIAAAKKLNCATTVATTSSRRIKGRFGGFAGTSANSDNGCLFGRENCFGFTRNARMARNFWHHYLGVQLQ